MRGLLLLAALTLAACGPDAPAPDAPLDVDALTAQADCGDGDPEAGLVALNAAVQADPDDADARVARGLCHWTRWAATADQADARLAYDDLTAAIEAGGSALAPLDAVYAHRAFVAHALDGDWTRTLEDLTRAAALDPENPRHALDLGVVRAYAGDTLAARSALAQYLVLADSAGVDRGAAQREVVEDLIADLESVDPAVADEE